MSFVARSLTFAWGVRSMDFDLPESGFVAIAGPNGAGKSTLVGILAGVKRNYGGSCRLGDREVREYGRREFARRVAYLPQSVSTAHPFTVAEVVAMGRAPHANGWSVSEDDRAAAFDAMRETDVASLAERDFRSLSGGERQRVLLAAAIAQQAEVLLLDEPATFLDIGHQLDLYRLLSEFAKQRLVVAVMHDLNHVLRWANQVLLMHGGKLVSLGAPATVLADSSMRKVFGVQARMSSDGTHLAYEV